MKVTQKSTTKISNENDCIDLTSDVLPVLPTLQVSTPILISPSHISPILTSKKTDIRKYKFFIYFMSILSCLYDLTIKFLI